MQLLKDVTSARTTLINAHWLLHSIAPSRWQLMNLTAVERFELHCPKTLLSTLQAPNIHNRGNNLLLLQMTTRDGTDCDTGKLKPYTSIPLKPQQPNTECRRSLFVMFFTVGQCGAKFFPSSVTVGGRCYVCGQCFARLASSQHSVLWHCEITRACFYRDRVTRENGVADVDRHDGRRVAELPRYPTLHGKYRSPYVLQGLRAPWWRGRE